jgi:hypothetical protein
MKRKPSRLMPKYNAKITGTIGWVVLVALLGLFAWIIWLWPPTAMLVPLFFAVELWDRHKRKNHFSKLLLERGGDSICTFSRHFDAKKVDTWVIRAVYEQLQGYLANERAQFPIRPTDDVFIDLLVDEEDFDFDLVEEIAQRTGRSLDQMENNPYFGKANIVENLVYFLNRQPVSAKLARD